MVAHERERLATLEALVHEHFEVGARDCGAAFKF